MFKYFLLLIVVLGYSNNAYANFTTCSDTVKKLHVHSNGNIYFNTDKNCKTNWCLINWTSEEQISRAYAALLASKNSKLELAFVWPSSALSSCSGVITESYTSPEWIDVK